MHISNNVSLKDKNWFRTGGSAQFFSEPSSISDLQTIVNYTKNNAIPLTVLGLGANVLINDEGIKGLVIRSALKNISIKKDSHQNDLVQVAAGSGIILSDLIKFCFNNNIIGLEEFSGIPSTVGGAIYINLHYFNFLISSFIHSAIVYNYTTNEIITVDREWFLFGYDYSKLHSKEHFLIEATFNLKKVPEEKKWYAQGRSDEIIRHRIQRYPYEGTCGSFFRNFHDHEVSLEINNKKIIFAAYYCDKVNVKGELKKGDAIVSHKHANMIVNTGNASSEDIIFVAREMQRRVKETFGIMLQPECELLGFNKYPLLQ